MRKTASKDSSIWSSFGLLVEPAVGGIQLARSGMDGAREERDGSWFLGSCHLILTNPFDIPCSTSMVSRSITLDSSVLPCGERNSPDTSIPVVRHSTSRLPTNSDALPRLDVQVFLLTARLPYPQMPSCFGVVLKVSIRHACRVRSALAQSPIFDGFWQPSWPPRSLISSN